MSVQPSEVEKRLHAMERQFIELKGGARCSRPACTLAAHGATQCRPGPCRRRCHLLCSCPVDQRVAASELAAKLVSRGETARWPWPISCRCARNSAKGQPVTRRRTGAGGNTSLVGSCGQAAGWTGAAARHGSAVFGKARSAARRALHLAGLERPAAVDWRRCPDAGPNARPPARTTVQRRPQS